MAHKTLRFTSEGLLLPLGVISLIAALFSAWEVFTSGALMALVLPLAILVFFIALLINFPLLYLHTEITLAHIVVLTGALILDPNVAILAAALGLLLGLVIKRSLPAVPLERFSPQSLGWTQTGYQLSLIVMPVVLLRYFHLAPLMDQLIEGFDSAAFGTIFNALLLFAAGHSLLLLAEMLLRRPSPFTHLRQDLIILTLIEITPLPFVLIGISAYPQLNLMVLALTAAGISIFAILVNESNRNRIDMERRLADISLINQISDLMRTSLDKQLLLETLYEQITHLTGAPNFYVALYDHEQEQIYYPIAVKGGEKQKWDPRPFMDRLTDRVIQRNQPLFLPSRAYEDMERLGVPVGDPPIHAWLGVPLVTPDQVQGCLAIFSYDPQVSFNHDDEQLLNALSGQVSASLANALLFERALSHQQEKLEMLGLVGQQISAALRSDELFELIMNYALEFTGAPVGCIMIFDPIQERFDVKVNRGYKIDYTWLPSLDGITGRVFRQRRPEIVNDVTSDPDYVDETHGRTASQLTVPILYNERAMGVIVVESPIRDQFNSHDLNFIKQLADQSALAILNAQLFDEAQRRYQDQSTLYLVSTRLVATKEMNEVLTTAVQAVAAMLNSPICAIYLYQSASNNYIQQHVMERDNPEQVSFPKQLALNLVDNLPQIGISRSDIHQIVDGPVHPNLYYDLTNQAVVMPLKISIQPLGLILAHVPEDRYLTREEVQLANAILAQSGIALQNARLFADVREGHDRIAAVLNAVGDGVLMVDAAGRISLSNEPIQILLEVQAEHLTNTRIADLSRKQLAALGFVTNSPEPLTILQASGPRPPRSIYTYQDFFLERGSAPLYDEQGNVLGWVIVVRDVTEQERTEQARSLITETVVHDLRSPIGAVQTTLDFLEDILSGESTDEAVLSSLNIAKRSTQRVLQLIGSLLDIGRLESGNMKLLIRSVNMYGLTNAVVHELQPQAQNLELSLHNHIFEGLPNVSADQGSISRVLYNLIDNALKFTPAGGSITIEAHAETEGELTISVTDTGPGVPLKYREEIFNRFSQVPNQRGRRRGTGLGLTFCRLAVEAHGGSIWLESGPAGIGSRFRFSLPLAESED